MHIQKLSTQIPVKLVSIVLDTEILIWPLTRICPPRFEIIEETSVSWDLCRTLVGPAPAPVSSLMRGTEQLIYRDKKNPVVYSLLKKSCLWRNQGSTFQLPWGRLLQLVFPQKGSSKDHRSSRAFVRHVGPALCSSFVFFLPEPRTSAEPWLVGKQKVTSCAGRDLVCICSASTA